MSFHSTTTNNSTCKLAHVAENVIVGDMPLDHDVAVALAKVENCYFNSTAGHYSRYEG